MKEPVNPETATYAPGTIFYAKQHPEIALKLVSYLQRIYYCRPVGGESEKLLAYFHRELVFPEI